MQTVFAPAPERGLLRLDGADRIAFLQNMLTADVKKLAPGRGMPAVLVDQRARVIDWLGVHADEQALWLTTGEARRDDVAAWLDKYMITEDVTIAAEPVELTFLTGPAAAELLGVEPWDHRVVRLGDVETRVMGAPGYGAAGFLLAGAAAAIAAALRAAGAREASAAELEAIRVRAGVPAAGKELGERTNPWEARLDGSIALDKGCYLGQEVVARLRAYDKVQRLLVGLELPAAAPGTPVLDGEGKPVGEVTSAVPGAALALVKRAAAAAGSVLHVDGFATTISDRWFWRSDAAERPLA